VLRLIRVESTDKHTKGILLVGSKLFCFTIELPWKDNKFQKSCIPCGTYKISKFLSPKHGECLKIHDVPNRSWIRIHPADRPSQLLGCIGLGTSLCTYCAPNNRREEGVAEAEWGVTLMYLLDKLPCETEITISNL